MIQEVLRIPCGHMVDVPTGATTRITCPACKARYLLERSGGYVWEATPIQEGE